MIKKTIEQILNNIEKVMIGKRDIAELSLIALLAGGHVLLEDVPGVGKTMMVKALAKSIGANLNEFNLRLIYCHLMYWEFPFIIQKKWNLNLNQVRLWGISSWLMKLIEHLAKNTVCTSRRNGRIFRDD